MRQIDDSSLYSFNTEKKEGNMHSEICPVCQGRGTMPAVDVGDPMDDYNRKPCHGCNGRGWVEVQDSVYPLYVPTPYIPPYDPYYPPYVPAPFDPGPWVCEDNQTEVQQKDFPQWKFTCHCQL